MKTQIFEKNQLSGGEIFLAFFRLIEYDKPQNTFSIGPLKILISFV